MKHNRSGMRTIACWALTLALAISFVPAAQATDHVTPAYYRTEEVQIGSVETGVNVRKGPGTGYDAVTKIRYGETCTILGEENDWYRVEIDGMTGYVLKELLTVETVQREVAVIVEEPLSATLTGLDRPMLLEWRNDYQVSGSVSSNIPLTGVRVDIYDLRALAVERTTSVTLNREDDVREYSLNRLADDLSFRKLNPGEKKLIITALSANEEAVVSETSFYVYGECADPASMTADCSFTLSHGKTGVMLDHDYDTSWTFRSERDLITIDIPANRTPAALTLEWERVPKDTKIVLTDADGAQIKVVSESDAGMLQRFYDVDERTRKIEISTTDEDLNLCELRVYEKDRIPEMIQRWEPLPEKIDMMIIVAHKNDELLSLGGTMSFAALNGKTCAVVYMSRNSRLRYAEGLDGMWTAGLRNYPIFLTYKDAKMGSYKETEELWGDAAVRDVVEAIRRYKPDVIVTHDINGEYGHNQHKLTCAITQKAVEMAADASKEPESASKYGTWDTPKLYIHLYPENRLNLPWDEPEEQLDGFTINQWTYAAFEKHYSQRQYYSMDGDGKTYDCTCFGLARTTVGPDIEKNSFFENLNH